MNDYQQPSADDFLMGGGVPSAKFPTIGTSISGRITERPKVEQQRDYTTGELKFWPDGQPQNQLVVTVATDQRDPQVADDDGMRRFYIKGQMKTAVQQAVRASGAKGLEVGGVLSITYTGDGEQKSAKLNPPKLFAAQYTPAATAELNAPEPQPAATPAPGAVPGLTAQQLADPAIAALLQQLRAAQQAAPTATTEDEAGDVPGF